MKKPLLTIIIILVLVLAYPFINFIRWYFVEKKPMNIIVVDKTVSTLDRINHKSLMWIFTSDRIVKKNNKSNYSYRKDYYGFAPTRPLNKKGSIRKEYHLADMTELPDKTDALYMADTYGVFFNDWYMGVNKSRRSRKIYGGLNNTDYLLINELKNRNKLIILEYNSFGYPTDEFDSYRTQQKLGISSSGWTGCYFSELDSNSRNFPVWMTAMYRKQYKKPWTFTRPGVVFLNEKSIIVLEQGTSLKDPMPHIITNDENCKKYGVVPSVAFDRWFDVIDPLQSNVISMFKLETTAAGDTLLLNNSIMNEFPAVTQDTVNKRTWYFAGDFAANKICYLSSRLKGFGNLKGLLYSSKPDDARRFFWLYYKPLVENIFNEYYASLKTN